MEDQDLITSMAWEREHGSGLSPLESAALDMLQRQRAELERLTKVQAYLSGAGAFRKGERVRKKKGSRWQGRIVGWYSTALTPMGYAVESDTEHGSVQIYPEAALEPCEDLQAFSSCKARIETLETALEEIAGDVGFLLRAIEDQDPYGELRLRVRDITMLVRDARSAFRSKGETA